jgi:hypothetical protein
MHISKTPSTTTLDYAAPSRSRRSRERAEHGPIKILGCDHKNFLVGDFLVCCTHLISLEYFETVGVPDGECMGMHRRAYVSFQDVVADNFERQRGDLPRMRTLVGLSYSYALTLTKEIWFLAGY